jgi:hypothetical protein
MFSGPRNKCKEDDYEEFFSNSNYVVKISRIIFLRY